MRTMHGSLFVVLQRLRLTDRGPFLRLYQYIAALEVLDVILCSFLFVPQPNLATLL